MASVTGSKNKDDGDPIALGPVGKQAECQDLSMAPEATISKQSKFEKGQPMFHDLDEQGKGKVAIIMGSLCLCVFLAALDQTIIATALPVIAGHFRSPSSYTWIGSVYLLATSASATTWGKFSDIWGRKPVLLAAVFVFFAGSLICALSVSPGMIISGRAVQGIGGGGLITLVNICVSDLFSMRKRPKYLGFVGMVWAISSSIGPVLGGVFTERASWRWCFYINLPITGVCFIVLLFYLEIHNPQTTLTQGILAIDWVGCTTGIGATVMFLLGLEFGGIRYSWSSPTVICLLVFGLITTGIFVLIEWRMARYPIIPLRVFKYSSNIAALGVCYIHGFVFISAAYFLPLYFQATLGVSPVLSGLYLLLFSVPLSIASVMTGAWISATGRYLGPLRIGLVLMTTGIGLLYDLPDHVSWPRIVFYQLITGVGSGPNFQAPLIALQAAVDQQDISMATSTFVFVRTLATSMSIVIGGAVFQNRMQLHLAKINQPDANITSILSGNSAFSNVGAINSLSGPAKSSVRHAYWASMRTMWILFASVSALGIFASMWITWKPLKRQHEMTKTGLQSLQNHRSIKTTRQNGPSEYS